ncbi:MAG: GAF domain-containing protein, partial [Myxococcaceae bacterium]
MSEEVDKRTAELARALAAVLGTGSDRVARALVDYVMREAGATAAWLLWADDDAQELRLGAQRGLPPARLGALGAIPYSSPDPGARVAMNRARQLVEDTRGEAGLVAEARAQAAVPIWSATPGRLLAVLAVGYAQPHRFDAEELEWAEVLSAQAGLALNASVEHETSRMLSSRLLGVRDA